MRKYIHLLAFILLFLLLISNLIAEKNLDISIIKNLLIQGAIEEDRECKPINIKYETGAFTSKDAQEAIISFSDQTQCHAEGFYEIWLFGFDKNWKIYGKILDCDGVTFKRLDIENDGRDEVWMTCTYCAQGCRYYGYLVSLNPKSIDTLFSNKGHNWQTIDYDIGDCVQCSSAVSFIDADKDNVLEIFQMEYREILVSKGKSTGPFLDPNKCKTKAEIVNSIYKKAKKKYTLFHSDTLKL